MIIISANKSLVTYGTSNLSRYLTYKHGKRLFSDKVKKNERAKKNLLMKKYVPYTVGIGVLGFCITKVLYPSKASELEVKVYSLLPLRILSRLWGGITSINLPVFLRPKVYAFYAKSFGVNMDECLTQDLTSYKSLSEFFIRPLREGCRPIDNDENSVVSPADGRVLTFGKITNCQVDQVKGVTYSLQEFLGKQTWIDLNNNEQAQRKGSLVAIDFEEKEKVRRRQPVHKTGQVYQAFWPDVFSKVAEDPDFLSEIYIKRLKEKENTELYHCVVYLAPGDYHRFHSPVDWCIYFRRHFNGKLLSVNPAIASWISNLFSLNERAVYIGSWRHGFFSMAAVGATNVGSIRVTFDPLLRTNIWRIQRNTKPFNDFAFGSKKEASESASERGSVVEMTKGDLFGEFRLGSTVVLIFEAPKDFKFVVENGQRIKYGERIGVFDE